MINRIWTADVYNICHKTDDEIRHDKVVVCTRINKFETENKDSICNICICNRQTVKLKPLLFTQEDIVNG